MTYRGTPFAVAPFELLWRTAAGPMAGSVGETNGPGRRYRSRPFDVVVVQPEGHGARIVQLEFERDLDDPRLQLTTWIDGRMRRVTPPTVGRSIELEPIVPPLPLWP